jgi:hypothetical protein
VAGNLDDRQLHRARRWRRMLVTTPRQPHSSDQGRPIDRHGVELPEPHLIRDNRRRQHRHAEPALHQQLDRPEPGQLDGDPELESGLGAGCF